VARRALLLLGLGLGLALVAGLSVVARRAQSEPLPELGSLPEFALTAHDGRPLVRAELLGRPFVADFIFTRCGGICPAMTARMAQLQTRLPARLRLVSFSVDPEHDTPEVLSRYARDFKAGPGWLFVTGPRSALHSLATDGFHLAAMELPPGDEGSDGPFLHSGKFVLVDGRGRIRGYYDSEDGAEIERLVGDAGRVSAEAQ
jgi:protein SCO1